MTILTLLFYSFCIIVFVQLVYYTTFLVAFSSKKPKHKLSTSIPISIIICSKNESENLKENIPYYLNQDYPEFELVLINDNSSDSTLETIEEFKNQHKNIKIVDVKPIEKYWGNKKYALTLGIKAASHEFLLFTDADCKPASKHWIREMASHFSKSKNLVLGYGSYLKTKGILNKLIRYETFITAIQYLGFANIGIPYMGVGRNLAYRKSLFLNHSGYMTHMHINSGDDDLFVNAVANETNTTISLDQKSFTISIPKQTFREWTTQKRRHISTAKYYKAKHKLILSIFYLSNLFFWTLAIILLSFTFLWKIVLGILIIRIMFQLICMRTPSKIFDEKQLLALAPFLEFFLIFFQLYLFIINLISKPRYWK